MRSNLRCRVHSHLPCTALLPLILQDMILRSSIISVDSDPNRAMPAALEDYSRIFPPMIMPIGIALILAGCLAGRMALAPVYLIRSEHSQMCNSLTA